MGVLRKKASLVLRNIKELTFHLIIDRIINLLVCLCHKSLQLGNLLLDHHMCLKYICVHNLTESVIKLAHVRFALRDLSSRFRRHFASDFGGRLLGQEEGDLFICQGSATLS